MEFFLYSYNMNIKTYKHKYNQLRNNKAMKKQIRKFKDNKVNLLYKHGKI